MNTPFPSKRFSVQELLRLLNQSLQVKHIDVRLECCSVNDPAEAVREFLHDRQFDVCGVSDGTRVIGYLRRDELTTGQCERFVVPFCAGEIISDGTSLMHLLPLLKSRPRLFVLEEAEVRHIVTRSDLQKPPLRMLLFGLVSLLEIYFLELVRLTYPRGDYELVLPEGRLRKASELWAERQKRNEHIDLADCLQIADKRDLLLAVPKFAPFFGLQSKKQAGRFLQHIEALRDRLVHAQDLILGTSWEEVIETIEQLEQFLRSCEDHIDEFRQIMRRADDSAANR